MVNNANELGPLHRLIPMTPPITEHAQQGGHEDCEWGRLKTRSEEHRQWELDRAHSISMCLF